jgi:hypothetical protein
MTTHDILSLLDSVRSRGPLKWSAKCPAHADRSPSLSITVGQKGLLIKCWAGCTLHDITKALRLSVRDLFYDTALDATQSRDAKRKRAEQKSEARIVYEATGRRMDALRQAEYLIRSARSLSIETWSHERLDAALERLAAAYALLEGEAA